MTESVSDEHLLRQIAAGDREALRQFYRRRAGHLMAVAMAVLRDRVRAEDVLQDAVVRIWQRAALFDPERGSALAWSATLTRRLALNEIKRRQRGEIAIDDVETEASAIVAEMSVQDPIAARRLAPCLSRLSEDQRRAVVLAFVHGLTHSELAQRLDRPLGTVKSWINRGLADLKECMR